MVYLFVVSVIGIVGRKYFASNILELINTIKTTQFGVVSTVQILATPNLRQKLFQFFNFQ